MTISASETTKMLPAVDRIPPIFMPNSIQSPKASGVAGNQVPYLSGTDHVLFTLIAETVKQWSITDHRGRTMLRKRKSL